MGYPLGLAPIETGSGDIRGTTPEDMQRIIGSRWGNPGIIAGCKVTGGASMNWTVSAGAVVVSTGSGLAVEVPVESTPIAAIPAPATGSRRDYIFVTAETGTDGDLQGQVQISSTAPSSGTVIATVQVPAGATSTAQMGVEESVRYALPVTASTGRVLRWNDPRSHLSAVPAAERGVMGWVLPIFPTDRLLEIKIRQCFCTYAFSGLISRNFECSYSHKFQVDGTDVARFVLPVTHLLEPREVSIEVEVSAGVAHRVDYFQGRDWDGNGFGGAQSAVDAFVFSNFLPGGVTVWDRGAIQ